MENKSNKISCLIHQFKITKPNRLIYLIEKKDAITELKPAKVQEKEPPKDDAESQKALKRLVELYGEKEGQAQFSKDQREKMKKLFQLPEVKKSGEQKKYSEAKETITPLTGSQFLAQIKAEEAKDFENKIPLKDIIQKSRERMTQMTREQASIGNLSYHINRVPFEYEENGKKIKITIGVTGPISIGPPGDSLTVPVDGPLAKVLALSLNGTLPTRKVMEKLKETVLKDQQGEGQLKFTSGPQLAAECLRDNKKDFPPEIINALKFWQNNPNKPNEMMMYSGIIEQLNKSNHLQRESLRNDINSYGDTKTIVMDEKQQDTDKDTLCLWGAVNPTTGENLQSGLGFPHDRNHQDYSQAATAVVECEIEIDGVAEKYAFKDVIRGGYNGKIRSLNGGKTIEIPTTYNLFTDSRPIDFEEIYKDVTFEPARKIFRPLENNTDTLVTLPTKLPRMLEEPKPKPLFKKSDLPENNLGKVNPFSIENNSDPESEKTENLKRKITISTSIKGAKPDFLGNQEKITIQRKVTENIPQNRISKAKYQENDEKKNEGLSYTRPLGFSTPSQETNSKSKKAKITDPEFLKPPIEIPSVIESTTAKLPKMAEDLNSPKGKLNILLGDSHVDGVLSHFNKNFPQQFVQYNARENPKSQGQSIADIQQIIDNKISGHYDPEQLKGSTVAIVIGANDLVSNKSLGQIIKSMEKLSSSIKKLGMKLVVATVLPIGNNPGITEEQITKWENFNKWIRGEEVTDDSTGKKFKRPEGSFDGVADIASYFQEGQKIQEENRGTTIHLNKDGYLKATAIISTAISEVNKKDQNLEKPELGVA